MALVGGKIQIRTIYHLRMIQQVLVLELLFLIQILVMELLLHIQKILKRL